MKLKITSHGEILLGGPTVMKGYYNDPNATAQAIDNQGWLHTGDIGSIDSDGHLVFIGRISETIKNSKGQLIIPGPIESKLCLSPVIDYALVLGENAPFVSALLFINHDELQKLKILRKERDLDDETFLSSPYVQEKMGHILNDINRMLNKWEQIITYRFILEEPTITNGCLTPTLKLKRKLLISKHKDLIDQIYHQSKKTF